MMANVYYILQPLRCCEGTGDADMQFQESMGGENTHDGKTRQVQPLKDDSSARSPSWHFSLWPAVHLAPLNLPPSGCNGFSPMFRKKHAKSTGEANQCTTSSPTLQINCVNLQARRVHLYRFHAPVQQGGHGFLHPQHKVAFHFLQAMLPHVAELPSHEHAERPTPLLIVQTFDFLEHLAPQTCDPSSTDVLDCSLRGDTRTALARPLLCYQPHVRH